MNGIIPGVSDGVVSVSVDNLVVEGIIVDVPTCIDVDGDVAIDDIKVEVWTLLVVVAL